MSYDEIDQDMKRTTHSNFLAVRQRTEVALRKRKRFPNRPLTEAQIRELLASIENIRDDALIRLGLSVGKRVSEVVSFRTCEIEFDRG